MKSWDCSERVTGPSAATRSLVALALLAVGCDFPGSRGEPGADIRDPGHAPVVASEPPAKLCLQGYADLRAQVFAPCEPATGRCGRSAPVDALLAANDPPGRFEGVAEHDDPVYEEDPPDDFLIWAGPWEGSTLRFTSRSSSRVHVNCTTATSPRFRLQVTVASRGAHPEVRRSVNVGDGRLDLSAQVNPIFADARLALAPGTEVMVTTQGAGAADVTVRGECGEVTIEGEAPGAVNVEGWPRDLTIRRPAASADVNLFPGAAAAATLSVWADWGLVRIPAGAGAHGTVPEGWAVACTGGVDQGCGKAGPVSVGSGVGGFRLVGNHGLLRLADWVSGTQTSAHRATVIERHLGATLPMNRAPDCFDILRSGCGWPWEGCGIP